ncbi:alpha/beta hydrolase [Verrucomicrobium sp. BvORR106]|uniref:alpha/beta hydrolase n=1 Tax=Verrucomicrobium sp. BvORR106 TaxID=1403819 RepID=UPI00069258FD|nr:alpha/beta hydrolase [Verrucomicrobium sp. BvORR106]
MVEPRPLSMRPEFRFLRPSILAACAALATFSVSTRAPGQLSEPKQPPTPFQIGAAKPVQTPPQLDVVYGETADGQKLLLDLYQPPVAPPKAGSAATPKLRPAVLMVHGGGWAGGNKKEFRNLALLMAQLGYVTVPVSYRLTTNAANTWPAQLDDVQLAVRWLRNHASQYGIDPKRIGAVGVSAGGQLVASLGLRETRDPATAKYADQSSRVACVVDVSGPTDLADDFSSKVKQGGAVNDHLKGLFGGPVAEKSSLVSDASPLSHVDAKASSFLIIHGTKDDIVPFDHAQRLHEALTKNGTPTKLLALENEGHAFQSRENQKRFMQETIVFFNQNLMP